MVRTGGSIKMKGSAIPTGGLMNLEGAKLTGAMLRKTLRKHLHPKLEADMQGAGLFDKLAGIVNMGNIKRLYGAIDKGISIGTKGYSAYRDIKKGVDAMKKKDEPALSNDIQQLQAQQMMIPSLKGGAIEKRGSKSKKDSKKSKRKLPEALKKRAEFLGEMMKKGHSMKEASDMYKA